MHSKRLLQPLWWIRRRFDRDMNVWRFVLYNRLCYVWSWSKGNRKISTEQPYKIDHYTVTRFYKKRHWKDKQICGAYVYLVLTSQVQARSSIVCNSALAVDAQQVFNGIFKALINKDYSIGIDIARYQGVLEHALSQAYTCFQVIWT